MFSEFKCGCIVGLYVGRVRCCERHVPATRDGIGGLSTYPSGDPIREYPANGVSVAGWSGR